MSSQIAYLTALSAWKHARGGDYIHVDRPNARMLTLKWIYQTVCRDGKPDFWPIRGAYGHNVWARKGLSGAGYFAIGIGAVPPRHRAAMKWCYERFLLEADTKADGPSVTVGGRALTFSFPGAADPPQPEVRGGAAVVGRQKVTVEDGHLVFAVTGK